MKEVEDVDQINFNRIDEAIKIYLNNGIGNGSFKKDMDVQDKVFVIVKIISKVVSKKLNVKNRNFQMENLTSFNVSGIKNFIKEQNKKDSIFRLLGLGLDNKARVYFIHINY